LRFVAKVPVTIYGIIWNAQYNKKDFTLEIQFRRNKEDWSEVYKVQRSDSDLNPDLKHHCIDFQDYDIPSTELDQG